MDQNMPPTKSATKSAKKIPPTIFKPIQNFPRPIPKHLPKKKYLDELFSKQQLDIYFSDTQK